MTEDGVDRAGVERAGTLLERFLANRGDRTLHAYTIDIEDLGRFLERPPVVAVARLLANGPRAGRHLALEFAIDLRRRGRAPATVSRRLATLRALTAAARELGLVEWTLDVPKEEEVSAAIQERARQASYMLPRHPSEIDRLDVQHYALCAAMGANHAAPLESVARVLDVGCGTGQWGFDMCQQLPDAMVVGLDLVPGKRDGPPRSHWVRGNVLAGLPFADGRFDFVHQRLLVSGVPVPAWPQVVADLVRVTRPGGWIELVEPRMTADGAGPATERLNALALSLGAGLGLDMESRVFDSLDTYLHDAGLADVTRRHLVLPIGRWQGEVGTLMATDLRAGFTRVCEVLQARSVLTVHEGYELIQRAQEEWEQRRTSWSVAVVYGRRPA